MIDAWLKEYGDIKVKIAAIERMLHNEIDQNAEKLSAALDEKWSKRQNKGYLVNISPKGLVKK